MSVPLTDADDWLAERGFIGDGVNGHFALRFRSERLGLLLEYSGVRQWVARHFPLQPGRAAGYGQTPGEAVAQLPE